MANLHKLLLQYTAFAKHSLQQGPSNLFDAEQYQKEKYDIKAEPSKMFAAGGSVLQYDMISQCESHHTRLYNRVSRKTLFLNFAYGC